VAVTAGAPWPKLIFASYLQFTLFAESSDARLVLPTSIYHMPVASPSQYREPPCGSMIADPRPCRHEATRPVDIGHPVTVLPSEARQPSI
jgi:hypothetical protein